MPLSPPVCRVQSQYNVKALRSPAGVRPLDDALMFTHSAGKPRGVNGAETSAAVTSDADTAGLASPVLNFTFETPTRRQRHTVEDFVGKWHSVHYNIRRDLRARAEDPSLHSSLLQLCEARDTSWRRQRCGIASLVGGCLS